MAQFFMNTLWPKLKTHANAIQRAIWTAAFIFVLLLMAYQVARSWKEIGAYPWQWNFRYLLLGFLAYSASLLISAAVWSAIIARLSGFRSHLVNIGLYCMTNLAMRLPTPIPFIGARAEAYAARGVARTTTLTGMSLEITVTIVGAMLAAVITLPFGMPDAFSRLNLWIWILLVPLVLIVLRPAWLFRILQAIYNRVHRPYYPAEVGTGAMLGWVAIFTIMWMNGGMIYFCLANSIYPISPHNILAMVNVFAVSGVIGWLGQLFFFVPNLAVRQVAAAYLLSFFLPWPVAVAVALFARVCIMVFEMLWALGFSLSVKWMNNPKSTSQKFGG